ncbi:MAG: ethanolamine ammonia-lyase small subunit, partial [Methylobacteriaceae bacterium]|nr:ethanolamine ammonia-lyase small subunit [Methylobacteriaceae bacterium]
GRTGDSLPTWRVLEFQMAHALAQGAVHEALDAEALARELAAFAPIVVTSRATTRSEYLQRPDLGRLLAAALQRVLTRGAYEISIVAADGLSARALADHAPARVRALQPYFRDLRLAPLVIATQGRVALGDEVAAALGATIVITLIGERPGLTSADSLGAYLTFAPRPGITRDAERNCVSNIRPDGLPIEDAARLIASLVRLALTRKLTGITLKQDEALALMAPRNSD